MLEGPGRRSPSTGQLKCDGTRAETRFRLSAKWTSQFKSTGASIQSTTGSRGVRISGSNAGYTVFQGSVKGTGYPLRQFPLHFPSPASPCAITFQLESNYVKIFTLGKIRCSIRLLLSQLVWCRISYIFRRNLVLENRIKFM